MFHKPSTISTPGSSIQEVLEADFKLRIMDMVLKSSCFQQNYFLTNGTENVILDKLSVLHCQMFAKLMAIFITIYSSPLQKEDCQVPHRHTD